MKSGHCEFIKEHFSQYLENCLEENERLLFEEHIAGCGGCRKLVEEQRKLGRLLKAVRFDLHDALAAADLPVSAGNRELTDTELDMAAGGVGGDSSKVCPMCGSPLRNGRCLCNPDKQK